jgi:uncharacterized NAD(P)/FAD-binding protein YdhS
MLANIASIEIPPLPPRLVDWLSSESEARLDSFGISRDEIDDRAFYPRLALGEYLSAQFAALVYLARSMGIEIEVRTLCTVTDVRITGEQLTLTVMDSRKIETKRLFEYVILATGHQWPADPELRPGYFISPWPASAFARIHNCAVGIRGTSLSAIDAAVALANHHGEFGGTDGNNLQYRAKAATDNFSITMFSRKGILPEADFYHPIPYEPLAICNAEAIEQLIAECGSEGLLDAAFELLLQELTLADAHYAAALGLEAQTPEEFCDAYFEQRAQSDPFDWARRNLEEAAKNAELNFTVSFEPSHRLFCLSLPFLLGQHPFAQCITSSAEMAEVVADAIQAAEATKSAAEGNLLGVGRAVVVA